VIFPAFLNRKGREGIGLIRAYGHFVTWFSAASKWFLTQRTQSFIARFAERFILFFEPQGHRGHKVNQGMSPLCYLVSCCFKMVLTQRAQSFIARFADRFFLPF